MLRKRITSIVLAMLITFVAIEPAPRSSAEPFPEQASGEWTQWRNTPDLVGHQELAGDITSNTVRDAASLFVSGSTDPMPVFADVNGDNNPEIFMTDSGRVTAISATGARLWLSSSLQARTVYGVADFDNDGDYEVLVSATKAIVILDANNGDILVRKDIPEDIQTGRFIFGDFDKDGYSEIVYYPYKNPYMDIYKFGNEGGTLTLSLVNKIIDDRNENSGGFSAYYPQLAASDMNGDGKQEIILSSWTSMAVYSADEIAGREDAVLKDDKLTFTSVTGNHGQDYSKLIDGDYTTSWTAASGAAEEAIVTAFQAPKKISKFVIAGTEGMDVGVYAFDFMKGWQLIAQQTKENVTSIPGSDGRNGHIITFSDYVFTDKFKVVMTKNGSDSALQADEIIAYGEDMENPVAVGKDNYAGVTPDSQLYVNNSPIGNADLLIDGNVEEAVTTMNGTMDATISVTFKANRYVTGVKLFGTTGKGVIAKSAEIQTFDTFEGEWISRGKVDHGDNYAEIKGIWLTDSFAGQGFKIIVKGAKNGTANQLSLSELQFMELNPLITPSAGRAIQGGVLSNSPSYGPMNLMNGNETDYYFSEFWPTSYWPDGGLTTILEYDVPAGTVLTRFKAVDFWSNVAFQILPDGESEWKTMATSPYASTKFNDANFSTSPITVPSNGKVRFQFYGGPYETTGYTNTPTVGDDKSAQPTYYTRGTEIYLYRQMSGGGSSGVQPYSIAEIMPHLADNGRNYGMKVVKDINGDGLEEIIMLNDGISYHIGVYTSDNKGALSIVGDQYFGYTAKANPDDGVPGRFAPGLIPEFYVQSNPVTDINSDGKDEMIYSVFTSMPGQTTGSWKIYVADPLNYDSTAWKFKDIATKDGYYLKGITHMLGDDKPPVLLMSQENTLAPSATSDLEFWTFDNNQFKKLTSIDDAGLVTMAQHTPLHISDGSRNGERKPYSVDINKDGKKELFISRSGRVEAVTINENGEISVVSTISAELGAPLANFTDADGNIVFLTSASGQMNAVSQTGQSLWNITFGGYLTVGTTIGDVDGDSRNEMIFTDKGKVHAYRLVNDQFEYMWDTPGSGKNANGGPSSVPLADMNGDGILDIVSKTTDIDGSPVIQVLDGNGDVMWDVAMKEDTKGNTLGTVSITDYVVGDLNGDNTPDILFSLSPGYPNGRTGIIDGARKELAFVTPIEWLAVYPPEYDKNYNVMRSIYPTPGHYSMADVDKNGKMEGYFIGLETAYRLKHIPETKPDVSAEELVIYNVTGSFSGTYSRLLTMIDGQLTSSNDGKAYYYWQGASNKSEFVIEFAQVDKVSRLETYGTANEVMTIYANDNGTWRKIRDVAADAFEAGADRHNIDFNGYVETDKLKVEITGATPDAKPVVNEIKVYGQQPQTFKLESYVGTIETGNLPVYYNSNVFVDVDKDGQLEDAMTGGFNAFSVFKDDLFRGYMTTPLTRTMWHVLMPPLSYNPDMTVNTRGDSDLINFRRQQGFADVDGDGKLEIALQYITGKSSLYRGFMYCYSGEGKDWANGTPQSGYFRFDQKDSNVQWTYDMKPLFGDNVMVYNITSGDIDNDGRAEFIATTNTGYVIAFNGEDNPVDGRIAWSIEVGKGTDLQMPSIGDIDNDGFSEVIVPASDGNLHVIDGEAQSISSVASTITSQQPNTMQMVALTVNTTNMANNTLVSVELVSSDGTQLSPAVTASGTIRENQAVIPLIVPSSVSAGSYLFKVTANSSINKAVQYTISDSAPAATEAVSFYDGETTTYSLADLMSTGEIITDGILFIPSSFNYQFDNGEAVNYSAAQGIYIGASITTKASSSTIKLRSSMGPIVIDNASFQASTGSNDISIQAGTYISAQGTHFTTKNSGNTSLTANQSIDLTNANMETGNIDLSAFNNTSSIITTNTNFHGTTPNLISNGGIAVTNP